MPKTEGKKRRGRKPKKSAAAAEEKQKKKKKFPLIITPKAVQQFKVAIAREQQPPNTGIRIRLIQVANGYRYDIQFERSELPDDITETIEGVKFYVDNFTATYLKGTELDFQEFPMGGGGFIFHRPEKIEDDEDLLQELFNIPL